MQTKLANKKPDNDIIITERSLTVYT